MTSNFLKPTTVPSLPAAVLRQIQTMAATDEVVIGERLQALWSGYGEIRRISLVHGNSARPCIVKLVRPEQRSAHRRGFQSELAHQRKLRSYEVELCFYTEYERDCGKGCRVPRLLYSATNTEGQLLILEDLDAAGYGERRQHCTLAEVGTCLSWLAHFHARFMGRAPLGLWEVGTYWHLATRPEELATMDDGALKTAAPILDSHLNNCQFKTLVHGDAKAENCCFAADGSVAMVDFQYTGAGCGMKDVAYLLSSCLSARECEVHEGALLAHYFHELTQALNAIQPGVDATAIITEWRALYPLAWADFVRFLAGWAKDHYKMNAYSLKQSAQALQSLGL